MKRLAALLIALSFSALASFALAQDAPPADDSLLELKGTVAQGGFLTGKLPPGSRVRSNGTNVPIASSGAFVIALDRDATPWLTVSANLPDGQTVQKKFTVAARAWDIQRIDGLPENQVTPNANDLVAIRDEQKKIADARARVRDADSFMQGFIWPVTGTITSIYGSQRILNGQPRAPHLGIDIAAPEGAQVVAPADGIVALAARNLFLNGNLVIVDHGLGVNTVYAHLSQIRVIAGQPVHRGDVLGTIGRTGRATGPNLHFGINVRGVNVDPAPVLGPMPGTNNTVSDVELKN